MTSALIKLPVVQQQDDMFSAYADRARLALRKAGLGYSSEWKRIYDRELTNAYRQHHMVGLSAIATVAAVGLEAEGLHEEAIVQIDFAVTMARGDPDASVHLLGGKAVFEALLGRAAAAGETLQRAQGFLPHVV